ncbi:MAG: hypothetical protein IT249_19550 [Chitinophagaceae bacterium]|nr:hypothetical protein [Chitinophagaceae bacterium]
MKKNIQQNEYKRFFYLFYYLVSIFGRKLGDKKDYTISGLFVITICISFNIMTVFFLLQRNSEVIHLNSTTCLIIGFIVFVFNWRVFMKDDKSLKIIEYYDNEFAEKKISYKKILIVIVYIALTFSIIIYVAYLNRIGHVTKVLPAV